MKFEIHYHSAPDSLPKSPYQAIVDYWSNAYGTAYPLDERSVKAKLGLAGNFQWPRELTISRHAVIELIIQLRAQGSTRDLLGYPKIVAAFVLQQLGDLTQLSICGQAGESIGGRI